MASDVLAWLGLKAGGFGLAWPEPWLLGAI